MILNFLSRLAPVSSTILAVTHRYRIADWIESCADGRGRAGLRLEARKMTYIAQNLRCVGGVKIPACYGRSRRDAS